MYFLICSVTQQKKARNNDSDILMLADDSTKTDESVVVPLTSVGIRDHDLEAVNEAPDKGEDEEKMLTSQVLEEEKKAEKVEEDEAQKDTAELKKRREVNNVQQPFTVLVRVPSEANDYKWGGLPVDLHCLCGSTHTCRYPSTGESLMSI